MQDDVENLIKENKLLKDKVRNCDLLFLWVVTFDVLQINDITVMLYQKIDENA